MNELINVPTAPVAMYSKKHKALAEVKEGATVTLPNDPAACALVLLEQPGWIKLRTNVDQMCDVGISLS